MKVLYLVASTGRSKRKYLTGQIKGWKQILNTLTDHDGDRIGVNRSR